MPLHFSDVLFSVPCLHALQHFFDFSELVSLTLLIDIFVLQLGGHLGLLEVAFFVFCVGYAIYKGFK